MSGIDDELEKEGIIDVFKPQPEKRDDSAKPYANGSGESAIASGATSEKSKIQLIRFSEITLSTARRDLVRGLIPREGMTVVWGPPKCGKSFWIFDLLMHVALGWEYREKRIQQGAVVYCAFEGQSGVRTRAEAFRQHYLAGQDADPPFFLQPMTLNLVADHEALVAAIRAKLGNEQPVAICLDTLNRSLNGSENKDEDMSAYIKACDSIREAFGCAVIIVHHCGIEGTRPRGHTSLMGAADAQLSVKRGEDGTIIVEVEFAKDGEAGERLASTLDSMQVGIDEDGETISSCIVVPADEPVTGVTDRQKLTRNQQTMFSLLHDASRPLTTDEWNELAREAGLGVKRRADLTDLRMALKSKDLIYEGINGWSVKN